VLLGQALADSDPRVRAEAVEGLAKRDGAQLLAALHDPSPAVRRRALARLPRADAMLDPLADALRDEDASVRRVAALSLATRPGAEAEAVLQAAAHFDDPVIRPLARDALAARGVALLPAPIAAPEPAPIIAPEPAPAPPPVVEAAPPVVEAYPETTAQEGDSELESLVLEEIRTSLRGRTTEELAGRLQLDAELVAGSIDGLLAAGRLVWRGRKLYLP
jgi:hypothetical protein